MSVTLGFIASPLISRLHHLQVSFIDSPLIYTVTRIRDEVSNVISSLVDELMKIYGRTHSRSLARTGVQDQGDNETVQTQNLGENEDQDL